MMMMTTMRFVPASLMALAPAVAALASAVAPPAAEDGKVSLKLLPEGGMAKIGYYSPVQVALSTDKPEGLVKAPADLVSPMYGVIKFRGEDGPAFLLILDEPAPTPVAGGAGDQGAASRSARLFVDRNGNGDLTDDPDTVWTARTNPAAGGEGKPLTQYNGSAKVNLGSEAQPMVVSLGLYRFDRNDPGRAALKDTILFYRDYALEGEITVAGKTHRALISDDGTTGGFRGRPLAADAGEKASSGVVLMIDLNDNGKFDPRGEKFDVRKPFNIGGTTYEIAEASPTGTSFQLAKSSQTVPEIPLPPNHAIGQKITAFEAKTTDDRTVMFPGDYKGKVVMIDFWATWCGPCMEEVPNLVKVYNAYHDQGFEILGISLDNEKSMPRLKPVTKEKGMTWAQVADGKYWDAEIAQLYVIQSIPAALLVDGDTGEIIADSRTLRGAKLEETIKSALARHKGGT